MTDNHFQGLRLELASEDRLDEVFALRHRAYLAEQAITPKPHGLFIDRYDLLRTSTLMVVTDRRGAVLGSIRFAVQPPVSYGITEFVSTPEFLVFPEELDGLLSHDRPIASGARFCIEPEHPRRNQVAMLLVLAQLEAARAVGAKWGIATARGGHVHFYGRFLSMRAICDPRPMPGLEYSYSLLAGDVDTAYRACWNRFPEACRTQFTATAPDFAREMQLALPSLLRAQAA